MTDPRPELIQRLWERRELLQRLGLWSTTAAAWPLLGGCGDAEVERFLADTRPPNPQQLPIETTVVVMMENRSFDHYFAALHLEEGRSDVLAMAADTALPGPDGAVYNPFRLGKSCLLDPPHGWTSSHRQFAEGANDGFAHEYFRSWGLPDIAGDVIGYHNREDLPLLYNLADEFALCQRWFCSVMGPTWPNRLYLHSATANGNKSNLDDWIAGGGLHWRTIYDQLSEAGISWKYYYSDLPFLVLWDGFVERYADRIVPIDEYISDAARGTLPALAMVDPGFLTNDDHPPHHVRLGQIFLSQIYHSLATSPQWDESMFIVTYDEHGGFYDHVPPPQMDDDRGDEGFAQLGFRVPGVIAGPWVRRGSVIDEVFDHASLARWLQYRYGIDPLNTRASVTGNPAVALDLPRINRRDPRPAPLFEPVSYPTDLGPHCYYELFTEGERVSLARTTRMEDIEEAFDVHRWPLPPHMDLRANAARYERLFVERELNRARLRERG